MQEATQEYETDDEVVDWEDSGEALGGEEGGLAGATSLAGVFLEGIVAVRQYRLAQKPYVTLAHVSSWWNHLVFGTFLSIFFP